MNIADQIFLKVSLVVVSFLTALLIIGGVAIMLMSPAPSDLKPAKYFRDCVDACVINHSEQVGADCMEPQN